MALHFAVHLSGWSLLRAHRALEIKLPLVRIDARLIAPQALARLTRSLRRRRGSFGGRMAPDHVGCGGDCFHLRLGGSSEARGWSTSAHSSEASILRGLLKRLANCACHSSKAPSLLWSRLVKGIRPTRISKHVLFFCGLSLLWLKMAADKSLRSTSNESPKELWTMVALCWQLVHFVPRGRSALQDFPRVWIMGLFTATEANGATIPSIDWFLSIDNVDTIGRFVCPSSQRSQDVACTSTPPSCWHTSKLTRDGAVDFDGTKTRTATNALMILMWKTHGFSRWKQLWWEASVCSCCQVAWLWRSAADPPKSCYRAGTSKSSVRVLTTHQDRLRLGRLRFSCVFSPFGPPSNSGKTGN